MKLAFSALILKPGFGQVTPAQASTQQASNDCLHGPAALPALVAPARLGRLAKGLTQRYTIPKAGMVRIVCGLAWLTLSNDPRDYWLTEGMALKVEADQVMVLEAEGDRALRWVYLPGEAPRAGA
jgi:hypothetical protein